MVITSERSAKIAYKRQHCDSLLSQAIGCIARRHTATNRLAQALALPLQSGQAAGCLVPTTGLQRGLLHSTPAHIIPLDALGCSKRALIQ
jgi:hypothetical protein